MLFDYKGNDIEVINKILKKDNIAAICRSYQSHCRELGLADGDLVTEYIEWQEKQRDKSSDDPVEFAYHLDRLLFGLGKSVKGRK